jgi:hypothetical protein
MEDNRRYKGTKRNTTPGHASNPKAPEMEDPGPVKNSRTTALDEAGRDGDIAIYWADFDAIYRCARERSNLYAIQILVPSSQFVTLLRQCLYRSFLEVAMAHGDPKKLCISPKGHLRAPSWKSVSLNYE